MNKDTVKAPSHSVSAAEHSIMSASITNPQMVVCKRCGLLVGWSEQKVDTFYCIPCFDHVKIFQEEEPS